MYEANNKDDEVRCVREDSKCRIDSDEDGEDRLIKVPDNINNLRIDCKLESVLFSCQLREDEVTLASPISSRVHQALPHFLPIIDIVALLISVETNVKLIFNYYS